MLAKTIEYFRIPKDVLCICVGKSTYARTGIICNVTPIENEFEGNIVIELSNTTPNPAKVYSNEGIAQFLFFKDSPPETTYKSKNGKYQGQTTIQVAKNKKKWINFLVNGPCRIKGQVNIQGSKNAALPILASTILFDRPVIIKNLPRVKDIDTMLQFVKIIRFKGSTFQTQKTVRISNKKIKISCLLFFSKNNESWYFKNLPMISKYHKSITSLPGGCLIGARPVNFHLNALKKLGMKYEIKKGYIHAKSRGKT